VSRQTRAAMATPFRLPPGIWARTLGYLPAPEGLQAARCRRGHQPPRCLAPEFRDLWIGKRLALVTLEALMLADQDLCRCLTFGLERLRDFQVTASDYSMFLRSKAQDEQREEPGPCVHVRQGPVQAVEACNLFHTLEWGSRTINLPPKLIHKVMVELTQPQVTPKMSFLCDLGLLGWHFVKKLPSEDWEGMLFENKTEKVPLALFDLHADFDLAGGDGGVSARVGFISTDLDFTVMIRRFCEYPVRRRMSDCSCDTWEELCAAQEPKQGYPVSKQQDDAPSGDVPRGSWKTCSSSMINTALFDQCVVDAPDLSAAYEQARRLVRTEEVPKY
ncbi:unnamed protein product, partial [Effrenium voratum]